MSGRGTSDFRGSFARRGRGRGWDRAHDSAPTSAPAQVQSRPRIIKQHARSIPLDEALELARKTLRADSPGSDIEKFFIGLGFTIKIAHPIVSACDEEDDADTRERAEGIDGMFALIDNLTQTSGIIIDARDNFRVLLRPQPDMMRDEGSVARVVEHADEYNAFAAVDGTSVTLYYAPRISQWLYATARSYDARGYRWMGQKTFGEAIAECSGGKIVLDSLDKNAQYTFIFRHPDFHLLVQDPMAIWQLSGPAVEGIQQFGTRAIADAAARIDELKFRAADSFNEFVRSGALNYGYVFERKDTRGPQKVYLESSLHAFVRQHIYDVPSGTVGIDYNTRALFMHLRAYMSLGTPTTTGISRSAHLLMFPQAADIFSKMDYIIGVLTDLTTMEMRAAKRAEPAAAAGDAEKASPEPRADSSVHRADARDAMGREKFGDSWEEISARLSVIAKRVSEKLLASGTINAFGDHVHSNIRDRYMSGDNLKVFVDLIYDTASA